MRFAASGLLMFVVCATHAPAQVAFLDKLSAAPGETVQVFVDSGVQYEVRIHETPKFGTTTILLASGFLGPTSQPTPAGSYAFALDDPALDVTGDISLEAWIRPSVISGSTPAGIVTKYSIPGDAAYGIYLMPGGRVAFYLGATGAFSESNRLLSTSPVALKQWTHVVATYDGTTKRLYVDGQLDTTQARTGPIFDTGEPVRVGSFGSGGVAASFFTGSIDSPAIHAAALTPAEVTTRFGERADYDGGTPGVLPGTVAQWNLQELVGTVLSDATGNGHDLTLVNHAHRSVPGPAWVGPAKPTQWCIRFSFNDVYNPPWSPSWSFVVPPTWSSGYYRVQVRLGVGSGIHLPFIVKPEPGAEAEIAVLASTNTWAAYNKWKSKGLYSKNPGGEINCYAGLLQPNPGGHSNLHSPGNGYSHLVDAERYLWGWLHDEAYPFDIYADLDLHRGPDLLDDYRVVMLSGHNEFWSTEMIDHLMDFQNAGGSIVNLSGNTMWSRITYNADFSVMEGRKHPWGTRPSVLPPGERWHSQAGQVLGGTIRCVGYSEHAVLGTGFGLTMIGISGDYQVLQPKHWAFEGTGVGLSTLFGQESLNGNGIVGFEADIVDPFWGVPANLEILARGVNFTASATDLDITDCNTRVWSNVTSGGDVVYFDHPGGGGVFGAPSVTFGGSLSVDAVASRMLRNVLQRFLEAPVKYCTAGTSASGCQAAIASSGVASATAPSGFDVSASGVEGAKDGLFFYATNGRQANPWGSSTSYQCVIPPVRRGGLLASSGTAGQCDGSFTQDLNARWTAKPAHNPGAGAVGQVQLWYRDPLNTSGTTTGLSDALEFNVAP